MVTPIETDASRYMDLRTAVMAALRKVEFLHDYRCPQAKRAQFPEGAPPCSCETGPIEKRLRDLVR